MGRIRTIKPEFFRHEELFDAEKASGLPLRLAFAALWTVADREGRFKWHVRSLKLECLPYDELDFARVLDALMTRGFLVQYEVEGKLYGFIPTFKTHQVINNREAKSSIPDPNENNTLTSEGHVDDALMTPLMHTQGEGKGREGERKEIPSSLRSEGISNSQADQKTSYYHRGKEILGDKSGGMLSKLLMAKGNVIARARAALEEASVAADPREYLGAIIRSKEHKSEQERRDAGEIW